MERKSVRRLVIPGEFGMLLSRRGTKTMKFGGIYVLGKVELPAILLRDPSIKPAAKLLYMVVQTERRCSVSVAAERAGLARTTVSRLCADLKRQGWVKTVRIGRNVFVAPDIPPPLQEQMVQDLKQRLEAAQLKGEFICKAILDYVIGPASYIDNARPSFLVNPLSGERLEYDRYYPSLGLAVEYNGPQHYGPTKVFPNIEEVKELKARDLMKIGLSQAFNITLITFALSDLSIRGALKRLPEGTPRVDIDLECTYARCLDGIAADYAAWLRHIESKGGTKGGTY